MNVPTDRRATVRLLLRGVAGSDARQVRMGGYLVIVIGEATAEAWPGERLQPGDLEAIVWTTPRQVAQVENNLKAISGVVATRGMGEN